MDADEIADIAGEMCTGDCAECEEEGRSECVVDGHRVGEDALAYMARCMLR